MPRYEGLITGVEPDGRAQVTIRPDKMGIPGAPEVSRRVCHTSSDGSMVKIDALNRAGAAMGDWVSVARRAGVAGKNLAALLGIPLLGGILGLAAAAVITYSAGISHPAPWVVLAAVGIVTGLGVGRRVYARSTSDNPLIIEQILKPSDVVAAEFGDVRSRMEKAAESCGDCTRCWTGTIADRTG